MLAHLATFGVEDVTEAHHVAVRVASRDQGAHGHERVEPSAGLVDGFTDEICGIRLLEVLDVVCRVAELREWHRAGVVPAIDHLGNPGGGGLTLRALEGDVVHIRPVRIDARDVLIGQFRELGAGAHSGEVVVLAAPDRKRGAPIARPGQGPVDVVAQPVAVPTPLDRLGVPVGRLVLGQKCVLGRRRPDVPRGQRVVDQRRVAPPAVRVGVLVRDPLEQQPPFLHVGHEGLIRVLEELPADQPDVFLKRSVGAHRVDHRQAETPADREVVSAEGRCQVHDAGTVAGRDEVAGDHVVRVRDLDEVEGRPVVQAFEIAARHPGQDLSIVTERGLQKILGDHQRALAGPRHHVRGLRRDGDRGVRDQCPRRRRPDEQLHAGEPGGQITVEHLAGHEHGRVDDGLVALREFVVAQRRATPRTERGDAVVLLEQSVVEDLLQRPPDAVDVLRRHGPVRLVHVHPVAHAGCHLRESVHVAQDRLATLLVEGLDAVCLDVRLAVESEFTFHGQFHRQPVTVPAGLARDVEALHGAVTRVQVLEDPGLDVMDTGRAVGGGRALVEGPLRAVGCLPQRTVEDVVVLPEGDHLAFHLRQIDLRGHRAVHSAPS